MMGNPAPGPWVEVNIQGVKGQAVVLVNIQGKHIYQHSIKQAAEWDHIQLPMEGSFEMLLLQVATQRQLIKLLRP